MPLLAVMEFFNFCFCSIYFTLRTRSSLIKYAMWKNLSSFSAPRSPVKSKLEPNGPIGQRLKDINSNLKPYVQFRRIPHKLPDNLDPSLFKDKEDLCLLFKLIIGVANGTIDINFLKDMLEMSTVHWYTTFVRLLRLWVQEKDPSEEFEILITFIQQECLILSLFCRFFSLLWSPKKIRIRVP